MWTGSLWAQVWVASVVFQSLSDPHQAGIIAARLFSIETYAGLGVAAAALLTRTAARFALGFSAVALLATNEWAVKPAMQAARDAGSAFGMGFGAWHGVSAAVYLVACGLAAAQILREPAAQILSEPAA